MVENAHNIPRCHHIRVSGVQCGSPALRGKRLCYFHSRLRHARQPSGLPLLEDANSIQLMLMQVMRAVLEKSIDQRSAGLLLYALQTAAINSRRIDFEPFAWTVVRDLTGAVPADATEAEVLTAQKEADQAERAAQAAKAAEAARVAKEAPHEEKVTAPFRAKHHRNQPEPPPKKKQPASAHRSTPPQSQGTSVLNASANTATGVPHSCEARVESDETQGPSPALPLERPVSVGVEEGLGQDDKEKSRFLAESRNDNATGT